VAGFAAGEFAIGQHLLHACPKLAMMRVGVTLGASERLKSIRCGATAARRNPCLVALGAGGRHVSARQGKPRGLMLRQRKRGGLETLNGVAVFALAVVWGSGKLTFVNIGMAILASGFFDLVNCLNASGLVTFDACHFGVFPLQRIVRRSVLLHSKCRGFESLYSVASHAVAAVFSCGELATVRVLMTVEASGECDRPFEVPAVMAFNALHGRMFAEQGILCFGVVKVRCHFGLGNPLPSGCRMTGFAPRLKCSMMGIGVAVGTFAERNSDQLHRLWIAWLGLVALVARDPRVLPRQWKPGLGVVKMADFFPVVKFVALLALVAHSTLMWVLVAGNASSGKAKESTI
jgi:hypothetical protein